MSKYKTSYRLRWKDTGVEHKAPYILSCLDEAKRGGVYVASLSARGPGKYSLQVLLFNLLPNWMWSELDEDDKRLSWEEDEGPFMDFDLAANTLAAAKQEAAEMLKTHVAKITGITFEMALEVVA